MENGNKKIVNAWCMYDWANSVYNLVIVSTMYPAYYESVTRGENDKGIVNFLGHDFINTALYNYALGVAFLVVALLSPILSAIADYKGNKRLFMRFFATMGSVSCSFLYFFKANNLEIGIVFMILACIGFWGSMVFYNSYLPEIAEPKEHDRISARGFTLGYIGSVLLQLICFVLLFKKEWFGISTGEALRLSFLLVGVWWLGFAQYPLAVLPISPKKERKLKYNVLANGFFELKKVWFAVMNLPVLKRFLIAFFFYNMGVQTIMLSASLYGKSELAIPVNNLITAILLIQLVAIPGALMMAKLSARIGNIKTLMFVVAFWIGLCYFGYTLPRGDVNQFYVLAIFVGFVMGGIQSLSRSTFAKLMPETKDTASFFSFYDVTEKLAIVIGLFGFGFITELFNGSQRTSVLSLAVLFTIGLVLLYNTLLAQKRERNF